jgi:pheromone receptor transcription factor
MASEITDHDQNASPSLHDDGNGALNVGDANRGTKRPRPAADDDDDDDDKPGRERRKIEIKFIQDKSRRHITFSKRKAGIMKKVCSLLLLSARACERIALHPRLYLALPYPCRMRNTPAPHSSLTVYFQAYELSVLTGTQVLLLVVSETGLVYTFTTPKLQPLVTKPEGKNLIQVSAPPPPPPPPSTLLC